MLSWLRRNSSKKKYVFNHEPERMDQILEGLFLSQQPDKLKETIISQICAQSSLPSHGETIIRGVLQVSRKFILHGTTTLQISSGFKVFKAWGSHNMKIFKSVFTPRLIAEVLRQEGGLVANVPLLIREGFRVMSHTGAHIHNEHAQMVQNNITRFLGSTQDRIVVHNVALLLEEFNECVPMDENEGIRFCLAVLNHLSVGAQDQPQDEFHLFVQQIDEIAKSLGIIWQLQPSVLLVNSLQEIFNIIASPTTEELSDSAICLAAVVRHIPIEIANRVVKDIVTDPTISDRSIATAINQILEWLKWPTAEYVELWVLCFLTELSAAKKYKLLSYIIEVHVEQVVENMAYENLRHASFRILSHMLLGFQHSPGPFHKCLEKISFIIQILRDERTQQAEKFLNQMLHLICCLMYQHTGFPELYGPILELLQDFPRPDFDQIQQILNEAKWSSQASCCIVMEADVPFLSITSTKQAKLETGKTGLKNLGNTCYMNSVIQALYMCDQFRRGVLANTPQGKENLLTKLQYVFAHLSHSNRPAISPNKLLQASTPPWFLPGHQQDCSEFLKHLLNQLHEDERSSYHSVLENRASCGSGTIKVQMDTLSKVERKQAVMLTGIKRKPEEEMNGLKSSESCSSIKSPVKSLVERTFRGKVQTTLRCLACKHESLTVESFTDIPLAFPNSSVTSFDSHKNLAGGGGPPASDTQTECMHVVEAEVANPSEECISLNDLISFYLKPEKLTGDNKYHCDKCRMLQDGEKRITIIESPQYLILTLLRFSYNTKLQARTKIFQDVCYPRTLSVPVCSISAPKDVEESYLSKQHSTNTSASHINCAVTAESHSTKLENISQILSAKCENCSHDCQSHLLYSLSGVIIHSGLSSESGHYYCYARHSQSGQINAEMLENSEHSLNDLDFLPDKWYNFNDNRVSRATFNSFSNVTKKFSKDTPYVLIYRKLDLGGEGCGLENDPILHADLRDAVIKDNEEYLKEQEMDARAREMRRRRRSSSVNSYNRYGRPDNDDDDDDWPEGGRHGCWEGLERGLNIDGSRYVF